MILLGIIGDQRVAHSLSPRMHNAVMKKRGMDGAYVRFAVALEDMAAAIAGLKALGLAGVNVTVPHKRVVLPFLDDLSEEATVLGAVNTIKAGPEGMVGHNSDLGGFSQALAESGFKPEGAKALVLGAGGAARAVALALKRSGAEVSVAARKPAQSRALCSELGGEGISFEQATEALSDCQLLVNATSVSAPQESSEMVAWLGTISAPARLSLVIDINYGRPNNIWQDLAQRCRANFMDGLPMLAHQARLSFQIWTGIDVPVDEYKTALETAS